MKLESAWGFCVQATTYVGTYLSVHRTELLYRDLLDDDLDALTRGGGGGGGACFAVAPTAEIDGAEGAAAHHLHFLVVVHGHLDIYLVLGL